MAAYTGNSRFLRNASKYIDDDGVTQIEFKSPTINPSPNDGIFTVQSDRQFRPDLISLDSYGTFDLDLLIMMINDLD